MDSVKVDKRCYINNGGWGCPCLLFCVLFLLLVVVGDFLPPARFLKTAGGIVLGSVAVSAVSAVSADVLPYISVAIKASFLKLGMCNICKNNIAKMFLDF